jgi:hypothetical protein
MSALTLISAGKVRQKCYEMTKDPGIFYALKALFLHLASNKNNPDLEFKVLTDGANSTLVDTPCTLYAIYAKKGTNATSAYLKISNHATVVQAGAEIILNSAVASERFLQIYPNGRAFSTGIAAGSYTAYNGSDSTTPSTATHNFYGFLIVGA